MAVLMLRLVLAPSTVLVASMVQRRLGPRSGGRLIGFPLTTGPFLLVLCLGSGTAAAAHAADGIVAGQMAVVGFCLAYGHLAPKLSPSAALPTAVGAAIASAGILSLLRIPWLIALVVLATIAVGLATWPAETPTTGAVPPRAGRRWETPARVALAGVLVAGLTGGVRVLGAYLAGLLSTAPVILTVMAPSTHRSAGPAAAAALVRGALAAMPASVVFVTVLAYTLGPLRPLPAFGVALAAMFGADQVTRVLRPTPTGLPSTT